MVNALPHVCWPSAGNAESTLAFHAGGQPDLSAIFCTLVEFLVLSAGIFSSKLPLIYFASIHMQLASKV